MKKILLFASLFALSACDGPWNTLPEDPVPPKTVLRLSLFAVGGRPFDTLWLDRTQPIDLDYDSTRAFVQSATVGVYDGNGQLAVGYHQSASSAVAWIPDSQVTVQAGRVYVAKVHVVWNADPKWPSASTWDTTDLRAQTKVPATWSIEKTAAAPVEMLIPELASGSDIGEGTSILDSLEKKMPGWASRWGMDSAMLDSLRKGFPVFRLVHSGDSLWYISDDVHPVANLDGMPVTRDYRQMLFRQYPDPGFAGVFTVNRFDPSESRILDPLTKQIMTSMGKTTWERKDSASYYQPGDQRYGFGPYPAYSPDIFGWPLAYPFSNLGFGYTGANTLYFYSVDSQYIVYQSQLSRQASGDKTALPYTNVEGGSGYFAAALVDSFQVHIVAEGVQTFPVESLRSAACRQLYGKSKTDGTAFDPAPVCGGIVLK